MATMTADERGIVTACVQCGQKNRVPFDKLAEPGRCGACKTALPAIAAPVAIQSVSQFEQVIGQSELPVLVDFWAPWCGPCRALAPELEKLAAADAGKLVVAKVNTEELPVLAQRFSISSIPAMGVFRGGRELSRTVGMRPAAQLRAFVRDALGER
ncbi:MAG TPA: thioredoxin [Planctomycetaceae bacterium]|nr:thioredoxin [Planctomycetaceae bacterium]